MKFVFLLLAHLNRDPKSEAGHTVTLRAVVPGPTIRINICLFSLHLFKNRAGGLNPPSDNTALVTSDICLQNLDIQQPGKGEFSPSLAPPQLLNKPSSVLTFFFSSGGRGQGERISVSQPVS